MDTIKSEELECFRKDKWLVLDTRTKEEYNSGNINADYNFDYYSPTFAEKLSELSKEKNYIVYCKSGGRSSKAMSLMKELGFKNVKNLEGGITTWIEKGFPITK